MKNHFYKVCTGLLSLFACTYVLADDWQANLLVDPSSPYLFSIDLPDDMDIGLLTRLAVELDGIDITATLGYENNDFVFSPMEPLLAGSHTVKLVILQTDGSYELKGQWQFETNATATVPTTNEISPQQQAEAEQWLRSSSFSSNNSVELSQRIADHNLNNLPRHTILSGAGDAAAELEGNNWQVSARTNYFLQSEQALSMTGNSFDIGEYQIAAKRHGEWLDTGIKLGHYSYGINSQLLSAEQRRGASVELADVNERVSTQVFAFRPDAIVGNNHFTGLSKPDNRIDGVSATIKPFSSDENALKITSLYYDGKGSTSGTGISGDGNVAEASGWSLALDKSFFAGKLTLSGEYARANYDSDGNAGEANEEKSDAFKFLLETRPFNDLTLADVPADILLGLSYQRIDTFFASLANPGLAADRDVTTVYTNFNWNRFSANLQLSHETNNVDDLEGLPTDRLRNVSWSGNYAFDQQQDNLAWLGSPYLQLSGFIAKLDRKGTPDNYQGYDTDNASTSVTLGGGSNYENWYWNLSHSYSEFDDHTGVTSDTISRFTTLGGGWRPSSRLSFNSDIQYGVFESQSNHSTAYTTNLNLGVQSLLIPNKLDLGLNYNLNLAGGDNDSPDRHLINAEIGWTFITASKNNPGIALAIRGSMENYHDNSAQTTSDDNYQVFAILRCTAPFSSQP